MPEYSFIGKSFPRLDAVEKVKGRAVYVQDMKLPGMLYGRILRSPFAHARILRVDASQAEKVAGVKAVLIGSQLPEVKYGPFVEDRYPLARDKVRFIGDEVAAVAATQEDIAQEALELIRVDYEELPPVFDPEEALRPGAPLINEFATGLAAHLEMDALGKETEKKAIAGRNVCANFEILRGDVAKGFDRAKVVAQGRFTTPSVHQCYLEPMACLARYDASARLTVWTASQYQFGLRLSLARMLGLGEGAIRVIQTCIGGSFGGKQEPLPLYAICAHLAKVTGQPVMMANDREEEFLASHPRLPLIIEMKLGLTQDGSISAKETRLLGDAGAYSGLAPRILTTAARRVDNLYRITNVKTEATLVYTNKTPFGAYRGFGNPQATFALESLLDEGARGLGLDPVEVRLGNATATGDVTVHGWQINSCGLSDCIKKSAELAGWSASGDKKGLGQACLIHVSDRRQTQGFGGSIAYVKVKEDGRALVISSEAELGQGIQNVLAQVVSEILDVPVEDIEITVPDTDYTPFCLGPFGDRVTFTAGNAALEAARDTRRKLLDLAAKMLEAAPADLELAKGNFWVRGCPEKSLALAQVAREAVYSRGGSAIVGTGIYEPTTTVLPDPKTMYGNISTAYSFGAQTARVAVDEETGQVRILAFIAAHDLGRAINPMAAEGQIDGSLAQGLGFALSELLVWKEGATLNPNLVDYRCPTALDMPRLETVMMESDDPFGPFGAKGVAEPGLVPTAPALVNAIFSCSGIRLTSLPMTPDKILAAIEARGRRKESKERPFVAIARKSKM